MPSMYRSVHKEGRLSHVLNQSLQSMAELRDELIAWKLGMGGTALIHRDSYQDLCKAIEQIQHIPAELSTPKSVGRIKVEYTQLVSQDKRRRVSRVKRIHNARTALIDICNTLRTPKYHDVSECIDTLTEIESFMLWFTDLADHIPWRFEKRPKQRRS